MKTCQNDSFGSDMRDAAIDAGIPDSFYYCMNGSDIYS